MLKRRLSGGLLGLLLLSLVGCKDDPPPPISVSTTSPPPAASGGAMPPPIPTVAYTDISMKSQAQRVPVIMYHDIIARRDRNSVWFDCTADEFEAQMKQIRDWGATPISLDQLYAHLTQGAPIPDASIVLTFDDNYQGFFDRAVPILHRYHFPAVMFVHTGFVGNKTGHHPKMTWDELKQLAADPLITIGNHTISHPADITTLSPDQQRHEIVDAKADLEEHLGKKVDYFAYPDGKNDPSTQQLVRTAGHLMAFTIENGPAEESPNIMAVNRYVHTRLQKAWDDRERALTGGALGIFRGPLHTAPVKYQEVDQAGVKLGLITGGTPVSMLSPIREGVLDFIRRTPGAVAGINGGFFAMAAIQSTDNKMVGPCKTAEMPTVLGDEETFRWPKLMDRPLVMWGPSEFAILPFVPASMRDPIAFADFMPDMSDAFLAGVWLVHGGVARERDDMAIFASKDIVDPRKRAFLGVMGDGTCVVGASLGSTSSDQLARAIAAAGVTEAVLLDSGFSTSLVYGASIKANGHSSIDNPSRPVPHAIILKGELDATTAALAAADAPVTKMPEDVLKPRRRRRRRRAEPDQTPPVVTPPLATPPVDPTATGGTDPPIPPYLG